jgi:hypothetical protein
LFYSKTSLCGRLYNKGTLLLWARSKKRHFTESVSRGRTFEVSYGSTEPKKVSQVVYRILFRFHRSLRNLKSSSSGYRFGRVPFFRVHLAERPTNFRCKWVSLTRASFISSWKGSLVRQKEDIRWLKYNTGCSLEDLETVW